MRGVNLYSWILPLVNVMSVYYTHSPLTGTITSSKKKKTRNKVLPIVLSVSFSSRIIISLLFSKFGQESTHWFMNYSKKWLAPPLPKKVTIFLAYCIAKKIHKNERTGFFHAKLCLRFERERYSKTHFTLFPTDNINSAKKNFHYKISNEFLFTAL